jgi:hypothetical protein
MLIRYRDPVGFWHDFESEGEYEAYRAEEAERKRADNAPKEPVEYWHDPNPERSRDGWSSYRDHLARRNGFDPVRNKSYADIALSDSYGK